MLNQAPVFISESKEESIFGESQYDYMLFFCLIKIKTKYQKGNPLLVLSI